MDLKFDFEEVFVVLRQTGDDRSFVVHAKSADGIFSVANTDGQSTWLANYTDDGAVKAVGHSGSRDEFATKTRECLVNGRATILLESGDDDILALTLDDGNSFRVKLNLRRQLRDEQHQQLKSLLFSMANSLTSKSKEVQKLTQEVESLRRRQQTSGSGVDQQSRNRGLMDFGASLGKGNITKIRSKPGMSAINPNSKKLKTTGKGVAFE